MLSDSQSERMLLGCLMIQPSIISDRRYNLKDEDFSSSLFNKRVFQAVNHLASHGAETISVMDIDNISQSKQSVQQLFKDNNLVDFVDTIKKLAKVNNFKLYYDEVKKCSLLNKYIDNGFDVSMFVADVKSHTIEEIVAYYDSIQEKIKSNYYSNKEIKEVKAGDGWEKVKESFKTEPMYGASTFSKIVNNCTRGWIRNQLTVYSVSSGSGKTTLGLYNLAKVCCKRIWSFEDSCYIDNPCYQQCGGLFVQFELDIDRELTPKILASISGVPCYNILDNNYNDGEEQRVDEAIQILHESNIHFITMPSYTIPQLEMYIRQYSKLHDCKYVVVDYIAENLALANEFSSGSKTAVRTDQVLAGVAGCLKNLATELNIAILSFTQTNSNIKSDGEFDASVISGSRAIQNTCDICGVVSKLRASEESIVSMMMDSGRYNVDLQPNRVVTLFKMRFSKFPQGTKVYIHVDLNTGYVSDCFATAPNGTPLDIPKLNLIYE